MYSKQNIKIINVKNSKKHEINLLFVFADRLRGDEYVDASRRHRQCPVVVHLSADDPEVSYAAHIWRLPSHSVCAVYLYGTACRTGPGLQYVTHQSHQMCTELCDRFYFPPRHARFVISQTCLDLSDVKPLLSI